MLRRTPYLVSYWDGDRLLFHNYATGVRIGADPLACRVLHFFDRWRSADALAAQLDEFTPASLRRVVVALERYSFLIRRGRRADRASAALAAWASWNPAAGFFHLSTKDVPYSRDPTVAERARGRAVKWPPMPSPVKRHPGAPRQRLPSLDVGGEFVDVLRSRRTWRRFSRRPITLAQLSAMLGITFGVQKWENVPGIGRIPFKTSPSGGARHSIEAYVVAQRVDALEPGLYHYVADRHELELLRTDVPPVSRYLPPHTWSNAAAAVVFMTAVFPRVQWRYTFPRAYRVVLAETGHLCQTFCLTATWLGLAPFCTMALADTRIERDLGIDGVTESVLYAAGVGTRPRVASGKVFMPGAF